MTLEHLLLREQNAVGLRDTDNVVSIRDLTSLSGAPALEASGEAFVTLIDSHLRGLGADYSTSSAAPPASD